MAADDHEQIIVFSSALRLKDVEYGLRFARTTGIGSPFAALGACPGNGRCGQG